jgi:paraquat-inducible protein B
VAQTSRHLRFVAALLLSVALVAALAAPAAAAGTAPKKWTKSVCGALDSWVNDVNAASAKVTKRAPKSAASLKKKLGRLLTQTQNETKSLLATVKRAGRPDVKGGKQIAATMREGLTQVQRTVTEARKTLARAPAKDPTAFTNAARAVQDALESGLEGVQAAFSAARTADAPELVAAFAANQRCQSVSA